MIFAIIMIDLPDLEKSFDETAIINWYILEDGIEMYLDDEESLKLERIFFKCVN